MAPKMPLQVKLLEPGGSGGCPFTKSGSPADWICTTSADDRLPNGKASARGTSLRANIPGDTNSYSRNLTLQSHLDFVQFFLACDQLTYLPYR